MFFGRILYLFYTFLTIGKYYAFVTICFHENKSSQINVKQINIFCIPESFLYKHLTPAF